MPEINKESVSNWNDFVFMNFLGIESLLNSIENSDDKVFNPKDYEFKTNNNPIYVKLA